MHCPSMASREQIYIRYSWRHYSVRRLRYTKLCWCIGCSLLLHCSRAVTPGASSPALPAVNWYEPKSSTSVHPGDVATVRNDAQQAQDGRLVYSFQLT